LLIEILIPLAWSRWIKLAFSDCSGTLSSHFAKAGTRCADQEPMMKGGKKYKEKKDQDAKEEWAGTAGASGHDEWRRLWQNKRQISIVPQ
jgi:DhnA family fructose-bisphosphate aldolase class Ia